MSYHRLARLGSRLRDDALQVPLRLDPVQPIIPAEKSPQFLSDGRHQSMGQVDLTLRVEDGSDDDLHGKFSESDEFCADERIMPHAGRGLYAETSPIAARFNRVHAKKVTTT